MDRSSRPTASPPWVTIDGHAVDGELADDAEDLGDVLQFAWSDEVARR